MTGFEGPEFLEVGLEVGMGICPGGYEESVVAVVVEVLANAGVTGDSLCIFAQAIDFSEVVLL